MENPRVLWVQYQNIKGSGLEQFKKPGTQVIVYPKDFVSGTRSRFGVVVLRAGSLGLA
jgi:hypothetical protein